MKSNYKKLGQFIRQTDERNKEMLITNLQGVSISKTFMPSIANIIGTDLTNYKIVRTGQFAYGPVTSRNGDKISVALLQGDDCIISSSYIPFEIYKKEELLAEYLMLWFSRPEFDRYARYMSNGSAREVFDWDCMCNVLLPVPSIEEQKKIVHIFDTINKRIRLLQAINENLEQQTASYFSHLYVEKADSSWRKGTISDLGTVVGGGTPSKAKAEYYTDNGIAWITPKDLSVDKSKFVTHGAIDITELGLRNSGATVMPVGTVLFSSRAPIGYIAIADGEVTTNQGFKSVIPYNNVGTSFMYFFLKSTLPIIERMASGSTFKEISGSIMRSVPAIIPDDDTLHTFSTFCEPIFQQQRYLEEENHKLALLRDSLLPRLMSGELDVSNLNL